LTHTLVAEPHNSVQVQTELYRPSSTPETALCVNWRLARRHVYVEEAVRRMRTAIDCGLYVCGP